MPRRCNRFSLALVLLLSGNAWALGLGEIRLDSALNAPMRAQIELLSATPEELENLQVGLASQETFERYGLDRPYYLQDLTFEVVKSGSSQGNYIRVTSARPITEPFLTFLVEAMWSRGRLLREYTVLLDPPTFAPPAAAETRPAVTAPQRSTPADSGRIERQAEPRPMPAAEAPTARPSPIPAPAPRSEPEPSSEPSPAPKPQAGEPDLPFDTTSGEDYVVQPRETLWGLASRFRPDFRLTMNQTMLAIYEANPQAFGGNINILRAGARLRIPSADDIYRIDRAYALNEAKRHHAEWSGAPAPAPAEPVATTTRPSLQLVPPDEEPVGIGTGAETPEDAEATAEEPDTSLREQEILDRISELEAADVPQQRSLIEIRDNELAALRQELADIRGELYEPDSFEPTGYETVAGEDELAAEDELLTEPEDAEAADAAAEEEADTAIQPPSNVITTPTRAEPSLLDKIIGSRDEHVGAHYCGCGAPCRRRAVLVRTPRARRGRRRMEQREHGRPRPGRNRAVVDRGTACTIARRRIDRRRRAGVDRNRPARRRYARCTRPGPGHGRADDGNRRIGVDGRHVQQRDGGQPRPERPDRRSRLPHGLRPLRPGGRPRQWRAGG